MTSHQFHPISIRMMRFISPGKKFVFPVALLYLLHFARVLSNVNHSRITATNGEPWPKPQVMETFGEYMILRPEVFRFKALNYTCDILEQALKRYYSIILLSSGINVNTFNSITPDRFGTQNTKNYSYSNSNANSRSDEHYYLDVLGLNLMSPCEEWPSESMDESYEIGIWAKHSPKKSAYIQAPSIWGILRGLETFSQLLFPTDDLITLKIKSTFIVDYPRFGYRSLLLDTARHFLSKSVIVENLDLMAMNKLNVLHWHIVDDESFSFQSQKFPLLSTKGAYEPYTHVYTKEDVRDIIEYARLRGIRVVPEFDTPGHTKSWGKGQKDLLTPCYRKSPKIPDGTFGPIDPTNNSTFAFLREFFQEVMETFPDKYLHLGGDEVSWDCWRSNPHIQNFMRRLNFSQDYSRLENFYMQKLITTLRGLPTRRSHIVWQEVFDNAWKLDIHTIVHIWKPGKGELEKVTAKGFRVLYSSCWYLDKISYGVDWHKYYLCDPHGFSGSLAQKNLVLGGGPAMWGEMIDGTNLVSSLWPRASVPAERLWSHKDVNDVQEATPRLEEHRCRLLRRGFKVAPINGPGFCSNDWL